MNSVWIYHAGEQESFFSFSKLWTQIEPQWGDDVQQDKRTTLQRRDHDGESFKSVSPL